MLPAPSEHLLLRGHLLTREHPSEPRIGICYKQIWWETGQYPTIFAYLHVCFHLFFQRPISMFPNMFLGIFVPDDIKSCRLQKAFYD